MVVTETKLICDKCSKTTNTLTTLYVDDLRPNKLEDSLPLIELCNDCLGGTIKFLGVTAKNNISQNYRYRDLPEFLS
jgi:hypothetical protein